VFCVKFQKEMPGLSEVPFEGHPLGQKIYEKEGWSMWLEHMPTRDVNGGIYAN
jgi:Fe-S cluster biosynthesis and repair protein YggX